MCRNLLGRSSSSDENDNEDSDDHRLRNQVVKCNLIELFTLTKLCEYHKRLIVHLIDSITNSSLPDQTMRGGICFIQVTNRQNLIKSIRG
ncbi:hypothetical protein NQ317_018421 [Molorchus minor]|uniref:Uncharacterized protein n=1 Tax=Molorchus minor TaxID=1323400 RepID=A0ABQ9JU78_9CUCU|nr:hypothetical protein NQ317_018421 [Molorchus minor]